MKILADASLPQLSEAFPPPFELTHYHRFEEIIELLPRHDILLCRSTLNVNEELLKRSSLRFVASASSGTDHVDSASLQKRDIRLLDAKGSNAASVADYVLATLAYLRVYKKFKGKKAGIVGMGSVGSRVADYLSVIGYEVLAYDPAKAANDPRFISCSKETLLDCDLICIHANLHDIPPYPSRNLFNRSLLANLKPNTVIINAARGGIVDEEALLSLHQPIWYCTDVFLNEPAINQQIVAFTTLCTPHIAGHSLEAKTAAVTALSQQLHAHYQITPPTFVAENWVLPDLTQLDNWQETILEIYNPLYETLGLKRAEDLQKTFLALRKQHCNRHNFDTYSSLKLHPDLRSIFA